MATTPPELLQTTPVAQKPPLKYWQCATIVLIALNVLVFLIMVAEGVSFFDPTAESLLKWGADYGPFTLHGQWWRMFVSTFLHFGLLHLLFNMLVLFNIGLFMESLAGRASFVVLYLVCGLGGSAASLAWHPSIVSAGASGAIFGLYGAVLGFILSHRGSIPSESIKAISRWAFAFIGYNLIYGLRPGVDMAAHLGGLATGFVLGLFLIPPPSPSKELQPASQPSWRVPAAVALGLALIVVPMTALPKPDDYLAEYRRLADMEDKDIALFDSAVKQWNAGQLSNQQYADVLETQILPPWRAERDALEKLRVPRDRAASKSLLLEYLNDREQSWQLSVDGLRAHNTDKLKESAQKNAEAEKIAAQLSGGH